jgi:alpha-glucosidase
VPGIQDYIQELCDNTFAHYDVMTVGEANGVSVEDAPNWVGEDQGKFNMLFQFEQLKLWGIDSDRRTLNLPELKKTLTRWQKGLAGKGWNALFVENHDIPRIVNTWGDPEHYWRESATAIATLYFLMQGTPFIYQGQELGMTNYPFSRLAELDDVAAHNIARKLRHQGWTDVDILQHIRDSARDNARTPMQWDGSDQAGFTQGQPWLKVNPNHTRINVATQQQDPNSVYHYYRQLIQLRREHSTLVYGDYELLLPEHAQVYAYQRQDKNGRYQVAVNTSGTQARVRLPLQGSVILSNQAGPGADDRLRPYEARVIQLG